MSSYGLIVVVREHKSRRCDQCLGHDALDRRTLRVMMVDEDGERVATSKRHGTSEEGSSVEVIISIATHAYTFYVVPTKEAVAYCACLSQAYWRYSHVLWVVRPLLCVCGREMSRREMECSQRCELTHTPGRQASSPSRKATGTAVATMAVSPHSSQPLRLHDASKSRHPKSRDTRYRANARRA